MRSPRPASNYESWLLISEGLHSGLRVDPGLARKGNVLLIGSEQEFFRREANERGEVLLTQGESAAAVLNAAISAHNPHSRQLLESEADKNYWRITDTGIYVRDAQDDFMIVSVSEHGRKTGESVIPNSTGYIIDSERETGLPLPGHLTDDFDELLRRMFDTTRSEIEDPGNFTMANGIEYWTGFGHSSATLGDSAVIVRYFGLSGENECIVSRCYRQHDIAHPAFAARFGVMHR